MVLPPLDNPLNADTPAVVTDGIGSEEADVLQGLNDVVQDMERETLYGQIVRPTITSSEGFGGHFAK